MKMSNLNYEFSCDTAVWCFSEYNQVFLKDANTEMPYPDDWRNEKKGAGVLLAQGIAAITVNTDCRGGFPVNFIIKPNSQPLLAIESFDHIVEFSLEIKSQEVQLIDCPTANIMFSHRLPAGTYRIRVYSKNIDNLGEDFEKCNSSYVIQMWPDASSAIKIIKQYQYY